MGLFDFNANQARQDLRQQNTAQDFAYGQLRPGAGPAVALAQAGRMLGESFGGNPQMQRIQKMEMVQNKVLSSGVQFGTPEFFDLAANELAAAGLTQEALQAKIEGQKYLQGQEDRTLNNLYKKANIAASMRGPERKIIKGADGFNYFADTRERVIPGIRNKKDAEDAAKKAEREAKETFNKADKLRDEFVKGSGDFIKVRDARNRVIASAKDPSPAGDMALIFNYMKVLDPGSVVRESEFATAAESGSLGSRIQAAYKKIASGERLADEVRDDFVKRTNALYKKQLSSQKQLQDSFGNLADKFNVDRDYILIDFATPEEEPDEAQEFTSSGGVRFKVKK